MRWLHLLQQDWQLFKRAEPGQRFRRLYDERRRRTGGKRSIGGIFALSAGLLLMIAGPIVGIVPGPGGAFVFLLGAILTATELRCAATLLDKCDLRLRAGWSRWKQFWRQLSRPTQVATVLAGLTILSAASYYSYRLFIAG